MSPDRVVPRRLRRLERVLVEGGGSAFVARRPLARLLGLAWLERPPDASALLLPRCSCVHTFGMRFPLEIAFLDADGAILRQLHAVPPRRIVRCRGAAAVLERPASSQAEPTSAASR